MQTKTRWTRWVIEASAADIPRPWSHVRPPRLQGVRAQRGAAAPA